MKISNPSLALIPNVFERRFAYGSFTKHIEMRLAPKGQMSEKARKILGRNADE